MSEAGGAERERDDSRGGDGDATTLARLYDVERDPRRRRSLTAVGLLVGLGLATVHWAGLFLGGALVGLAQPTLGRALLAGVGYGLGVLVVAGVGVTVAGTLDAVVGTWPLVAVGIAVPLLAGPVGALARGLLPDAPVTGTRDWD